LADVLIVDDDPPMRHLLRRFLEPAGYWVREAGSAREALAQIAESAPAVALCDVHMPGGANGLWLAEQIRLQAPATAIVLVTGDPEIPPTESLRSGVVGYLLKPLNREVLVRIVDDAMIWSSLERDKPSTDVPGRLRLVG
jgi:DNA-binding NtrC family response regulator